MSYGGTILHTFKEEGMGRHGLSCLCTPTTGDDLPELFEGHAVASYLYEGSDDCPHHVAEETVGSNLEIPGVRRCLVPLRSRNMAQGGLHIAACLAEGTKVVMFQEQ